VYAVILLEPVYGADQVIITFDPITEVVGYYGISGI
jgi:hypothetical protein